MTEEKAKQISDAISKIVKLLDEADSAISTTENEEIMSNFRKIATNFIGDFDYVFLPKFVKYFPEYRKEIASIE
jgi:hypothetical protein